MRVAYRLTLAAALAVALPAVGEDKPKAGDAPKSGVLNPNAGSQLHSAGQVVAKLSKADGNSVTVKLPEIEQKQNINGGKCGGKRGKGGGNLQRVEKDHEFDLTSDAKVRWHDLPKKADGKSYTKDEYQKLLDPPGTPGYKADMSDLRAGQTVRLYLSKESGKDAKVRATVVMILADAPKNAESKQPEKPKKKKKE
jgi:hypothetical protein